MVGLSLVTPAAGRDDLDHEIKRAEEAYDRAFKQMQAMGRYHTSDAEAKALSAAVKTLATRLDDLRARRIAVSYGLDEAPVTRSRDDGDFQKIDSRIRAHSAAVQNLIDARIERRVQTALAAVQEDSTALRAEINAVRSESKTSALQMANRLMAQRETREQGQREAERDILACRREIADLREELRALKGGTGPRSTAAADLKNANALNDNGTR
jgi:chromosome segregation ATPase